MQQAAFMYFPICSDKPETKVAGVVLPAGPAHSWHSDHPARLSKEGAVGWCLCGVREL